MAERVTAGRDWLGGFAPQFEGLNDDVLFGQTPFAGVRIGRAAALAMIPCRIVIKTFA